MKFKGLIICGILFIAVANVRGGILGFGNYYDYVYTQDGGATHVTSSDNWVYALYWDQTGDGANTYGDADDTCLFYGNSGWNSSYDGLLYDTANSSSIVDGELYFVRVYNSSDWTTSSVGSATHYVNLDMVEDNDGATYSNYDDNRVYDTAGGGVDDWAVGNAIGGSNPDGSDWQPIPEPGTFALFGIGLATIIARRKLRK